MDFAKALSYYPVIITEGSIIERLKREYSIELDANIANAGLIYDAAHRRLLTGMYRQYIDITCERDLPILLFTPTWRANAERIRLANLAGRDVNKDCYEFLAEIRDSYGNYAEKIFIGGLIGCKGDAYKPAEALTTADAEAFHAWQIERLAGVGVDFLTADTLPAISEALGLARAMAKTGQPYLVSFVIRDNGALLDGTAIAEAIARIDGEVRPRPTGYTVNCVHPANLKSSLLHPVNSCLTANRMLGLMGNTSAKSPEELDNAAALETEEPEIWAQQMVYLNKALGIKILGGCCGTDNHHIKALVDKV
jgi:homocysteine S-methyltransferase